MRVVICDTHVAGVYAAHSQNSPKIRLALSDPPLSSVRPDAERVGYRAAEVLDAMTNGKPAPTAVEYISPKAVVQRMSTQVIAVED